MEDPSRVGRGQPLGDVDAHLERASHRQPAPVEPALQRLALDELEDHVGEIALAPHVVDGDDGGVGDGTRRARLVLEEAQPLRVSHRVRVEDLDRDLAVEPGVAGPEDLRHAPDAQGCQELVRPQALPRRRRGPRPR